MSQLKGGGEGPKQVGTMSQLYVDFGFEGFPYKEIKLFGIIGMDFILSHIYHISLCAAF